MPAAAKRPRSAGSSSWTCSILGMNGTCAARRLEGVERGPHGRIADGVDLRGDPAGGRSRHELAQPLGLGDPDAAPQLGGERTVGLGLDVGQERRGPRPERAVGEALLPADPGPPVGIGAERPRRSADRRPAPCRAHPRAATPSPGPGAGRSPTGARRPDTTTPGRGPARARPGRGPRRRRGVSSSSETATMAASRSASAIGGMWTVTRRVAASCRTPSASPSASRRMTPPAGSGVSRSRRPPSSAARLASSAWWSCAQSAQRRPGRDGLEVVGRRPAAPAVDVPAVALEPRPGIGQRARGRPGRAPGRRRASRHRSGRPGASRRRHARGGGARR